MSEIINCGIYIFSPAALFKLMGEIIQKNYQKMRYAVVISSCLSSIIGMPVDIFWKEQPYFVLQHDQILLHCGKRGRVGRDGNFVPLPSPPCALSSVIFCHLLRNVAHSCPHFVFISNFLPDGSFLVSLPYVLCPLPCCLVQLAKFKVLLMMIMHVCFYNLSEEPFPGNVESVRMGEDVLATLASAGSLYAFKSTSFWSSIKNAG